MLHLLRFAVSHSRAADTAYLEISFRRALSAIPLSSTISEGRSFTFKYQQKPKTLFNGSSKGLPD